jgi:hypothetical protein
MRTNDARTNDARRLDHATLEAMRERAVRSVHEGESPEVWLALLVSIVRRFTAGWHSIDAAAGAR